MTGTVRAGVGNFMMAAGSNPACGGCRWMPGWRSGAALRAEGARAAIFQKAFHGRDCRRKAFFPLLEGCRGGSAVPGCRRGLVVDAPGCCLGSRRSGVGRVRGQGGRPQRGRGGGRGTRGAWRCAPAALGAGHGDGQQQCGGACADHGAAAAGAVPRGGLGAQGAGAGGDRSEAAAGCAHAGRGAAAARPGPAGQCAQ